MPLGGPDGESGAAMRYLSQRYSMKNARVAGVLTDIATEESAPRRYLFIGREKPILPASPSIICLICLERTFQFGLLSYRIHEDA
ncbi:MAG: manganese catalase family protein [Lachnospiraceae bacterium]|nr:manganese catalase family protein [Lachnospiraceae bacterium]